MVEVRDLVGHNPFDLTAHLLGPAIHVATPLESRQRRLSAGRPGILPLFESQAIMRRPQYLIEFVEEFRRMTTATTQATRTWMCLICGWIYDEAAGLPDDGIAPGTRWEDVPPNWTCPECGARKEDFEMVEI